LYTDILNPHRASFAVHKFDGLTENKTRNLTINFSHKTAPTFQVEIEQISIHCGRMALLNLGGTKP
jgi:hypothetical protein